MYGYVIFTDIEKYSTLKDADLKIYFNKIIPIISEELKIYKDAAIIWNTWGDAIFAIYDKAETAINMALAYRESFNKLNFEEFGIRKLTPRIAGNFGEFELIFDPVSGKKNVHGTLVNLTARIEPVTTPGEIFVTKEFKDMSISSYDKVENVRFEDMGEIKLPKNAGVLNLYRLCKRAETPIKPAGIVLSNISYNIQAPMAKTTIVKKAPEKTIEQRLSSNLNKPEASTKKVSSEEKINKLANVLKEETVVRKKETNFIKDFIVNFKRKRNFKELLGSNPFLIAIIVFVTAMIINFVLNMLIANFGSNIPILTPQSMAVITPWMWITGYIISSFLVGQVITLIQKKIIKIKNIIIAPILLVVLHFLLYILPNGKAPVSVFFMQNLYVNVTLLWFVCFIGVSKGSEIANDKMKEAARNK